MVVLHICLLHLHTVVCPLVFVVFFRTFRHCMIYCGTLTFIFIWAAS